MSWQFYKTIVDALGNSIAIYHKGETYGLGSKEIPIHEVGTFDEAVSRAWAIHNKQAIPAMLWLRGEVNELRFVFVQQSGNRWRMYPDGSLVNEVRTPLFRISMDKQHALTLVSRKIVKLQQEIADLEMQADAIIDTLEEL